MDHGMFSWTDNQIGGWMIEWFDGWMSEQMHRWVDEWIDRQRDKNMHSSRTHLSELEAPGGVHLKHATDDVLAGGWQVEWEPHQSAKHLRANVPQRLAGERERPAHQNIQNHPETLQRGAHKRHNTDVSSSIEAAWLVQLSTNVFTLCTRNEITS